MQEKSIRYNLIYMLSSGLFIKILALVYKIFLTRSLGLTGMGLYSIMIPSVMLFLGLADFSLPQTITKLVSENKSVKESNRSLIIKSIYIGLLFDLILILILLIFMNLINKSLNYDFRLPFYALMILLPFVSINAIIKGYFQGINRGDLGAKANIIEQLTRITSSIIFINLLINVNIDYALASIIISMAIGELFSFLFSLFKLRNYSFKPVLEKNGDGMKIISLSLPSTINRFIFTISNFFEPIILTKALNKLGYLDTEIRNSFGLVQGYAIPLLTIMGFASMAITQSLMPKLAQNFKTNSPSKFQSTLKKGLDLTFIIGFLSSLLLFFYPNLTSSLIYNDNSSSFFIKLMAPFFILYYLEPLLHTAILVINKSNLSLLINIFICLGKLILIYFLSSKIGIDGFVLAIIISIILTLLSYYLILKIKVHININIIKPLFFILINTFFTFLIKKDESIIMMAITLSFFLLTLFLFYGRTLKGINID